MHRLKFCLLLLPVLLLQVTMSAQSTGCISGNCYNGIGTYLFADNAEYTGEWVNGVRTGVGCYDWADGSFYLGYFLNGKLDGNGIYLGNDDDETTLVGLFRDGKLVEAKDFGTSGCLIGNCYEGVGIYLWSNDDLYVGEWRSGIRTGYGRFDWSGGDFYTGYFKNNLLDGRGYYSKKDGTVMDGYFEQNTFIRKADQATQSQATASTPAVAASNATYATYDDVCSLLKEVIKSYPGDFSGVKGSTNSDYLAFYQWHSSVSMSGSIETGIYASLTDPSLPALWYCTLSEFTDVKQAMDTYDAMVNSFSQCQVACGSMTSRNTSEPNEAYSAYFKPSSGSVAYAGMEVIFDLTYDDVYKDWTIEVQVVNNEKFR